MRDKVFLDTNIFIYSIDASPATLHPDFDMVVSGIYLHKKYKVSFWDALILQAAKTAGCSQVLSEDLQDGLRLDDLSVRNPFLS